MPRLLENWSLLLALAAVVTVGCKPKIGDSCRISTDCSAAGDRLCDITAPGGYCTVFSCEPGTCPEGESLCVEFGEQRSPLKDCRDQQAPSPYARTFCMGVCEKDSDCRGGYTCADLSVPGNDWGALLIDTDRGKRACVVPLSAQPVDANTPPDVCHAQSAVEAGQGGAGG
jgi:hypothetical protein